MMRPRACRGPFTTGLVPNLVCVTTADGPGRAWPQRALVSALMNPIQ